jgi:hypothetical protein
LGHALGVDDRLGRSGEIAYIQKKLPRKDLGVMGFMLIFIADSTISYYVVSQLESKRPAKCRIGDRSSVGATPSQGRVRPALTFLDPIRLRTHSFATTSSYTRGTKWCTVVSQSKHGELQSHAVAAFAITSLTRLVTIEENMKILQRLTVMMLLPAVGSGGRWNGGAGVLDDRDADRGGIHESMRTPPDQLDGTIHDTDHGPRQGFASDHDGVASPSSSSA